MCKKGLFLPQKSVGKAVFAFLVHFPEVQILVEISRTKWQNMAILRLRWRGPTEQEKVNSATSMCKKGLFLPHTCWECSFCIFGPFPRDPNFCGNFLLTLEIPVDESRIRDSARLGETQIFLGVKTYF